MIKRRIPVVTWLMVLMAAAVIAACGGGGGGGGNTVASVIIPRHAYVANAYDDSVSSYVADNATGRLKYIGKVAAGTTPASVITTGTWQ